MISVLKKKALYYIFLIKCNNSLKINFKCYVKYCEILINALQSKIFIEMRTSSSEKNN